MIPGLQDSEMTIHWFGNLLNLCTFLTLYIYVFVFAALVGSRLAAKLRRYDNGEELFTLYTPHSPNMPPSPYCHHCQHSSSSPNSEHYSHFVFVFAALVRSRPAARQRSYDNGEELFTLYSPNMPPSPHPPPCPHSSHYYSNSALFTCTHFSPPHYLPSSR